MRLLSFLEQHPFSHEHRNSLSLAQFRNSVLPKRIPALVLFNYNAYIRTFYIEFKINTTLELASFNTI